jgi:D-sedoheptulose 7-phosphate isomerase
MSKRQKNLQIKTFSFDPILTAEAAHSPPAAAMLDFFGLGRLAFEILFAAVQKFGRVSLVLLLQNRTMTFDAQLAETLKTFQALAGIRPEIDRAGQMVLSTLRAGKKLILCGNGGSAAEAQHFATELAGRYANSRRALPAIALNADGSLLTCIANDFGYDDVFARQLAAFAQPGDLLVALTSSGNSANILAALAAAKKLGLDSLAFLGRGGGKAKGLATCELIMPGASGSAAQEAHLFLIHHFCELIDAAFP